MHSSFLDRRSFLKTGSLAAAGICLPACRTPRRRSANEKLNIAVIGVANRGGDNLKGVAGENIVALCDVDSRYLAAAGEQFPAAKKFTDFRRLLEERNIDAVVVSTPDHNHAVMTVAALRSGRPVYCEKPLTHTISEARIVAREARRAGVPTQMGNQIHAGNNYRRVVELVQRGAIGSVKEVHVWVDATYGGKPLITAAVPAHIDYEQWLGPVPYRPYSPDYVPFKWRNWWAFGGGTLSDFCCHHIDLPKWALALGLPASIEAEGPPVDAESVPPWLIVKYAFPARENLPPVALTWYHGGKRPDYFKDGVLPKWGDGTLFVGSEGMLLASYGAHKLLPENKFSDFKRPAPFIPDSIGHHAEWIQACKTNGKTTCHFTYGAELTETGLLGNVAYRAGCKLNWNPRELAVPDCPAAAQYVQHHYRKGWKI